MKKSEIDCYKEHSKNSPILSSLKSIGYYKEYFLLSLVVWRKYLFLIRIAIFFL